MIGNVRVAGTASPGPSRRATVAGTALLIVSLACIAAITLKPAWSTARLPFWCFRCGTRAGVDVLLNILMFVPVGAALSLLRVRQWWAVLFIVGLTVTIEALQYTVIPGRFASARDIFANSIGGLVAWRIVTARRSVMSPTPARAFALGLLAALAWVTTQLFTSWAMSVVVPSGPWWSQIKSHDHSFPAYFRGDVVRSSLGRVDISSSDQLEETEPVRQQFLNESPVTVVVTGAVPTAGSAPILMLAADDRLREIATLAQRGSDAFFRVRTRAALIGLRNPALRLDDVFVAGSADDTIVLTGRRSRGRYWIASDGGGRHRERALAVSPSWGWALLLPITQYSFGPEVRFVTALWVFGALAVVAFWASQGAVLFADRAPSTARAFGIAPIIAAVGIGLGVIPMAFDLPIAHWSEWIAASSGVACGWLIGRHFRLNAGEDATTLATPNDVAASRSDFSERVADAG